MPIVILPKTYRKLAEELISAEQAMRIPTAAAPAGLGRFVDLRVTLAAAALASSLSFSAPALAVGPENIALSVKSYEEVTCPETLAQGRAGGSLGAGASIGIAQKCVQVKAAAENNSDTAIPDAAVFGFVYNVQDGSSVVANNPDGRTDAGQFAMIDSVPKGKSEVDFIFVAQQNTDCRPTRKEKCPVQGTEPLVPLRFQGIKARASPAHATALLTLSAARAAGSPRRRSATPGAIDTRRTTSASRTRSPRAATADCDTRDGAAPHTKT